MFLFRRFVLRQLAREPLRTAATVAGVALGVAVVVAIRLANASSIAGFGTALEAMSGRTSLEIVGSGLGIDEQHLSELGWLRTWGAISPVVEGDVAMPSGGSRPEMLRVLGVDILRDRHLRDYALLDVGAPAGSARERTALTSERFLALLREADSVVLTEKLARRRGLAIGDVVPLLIGDRERRFVIRGLLRDEGPARVLDGNFALMDIAAAQWALDRLGRIDRLDLRLDDPAAIDAAEAAIARRLPSGLAVQRPERRGRQVERMLAAFHLNLTALSYIALLVGLFLVYNTISTSVIVRREEIGALRALGTSRAHVLGLFLGEALALAVPGCALGVALGRFLADGAVALTGSTVSALYVAAAAAPPALTWTDVGVGVGIGLPLALLAAALPALEGARVAPIAAIRGADRLQTRYAIRLRQLLVPFLLIALAAVFARQAPVGDLPLGGYASALALVFGAAFLVPVVLFLVGRAGRFVVRRGFVVEAWLANASLAGAIPRLSVSVAALAVALSMMVAIAVMIGSFRETVVYWVGQTLHADLFVGPVTRGRGARQATISRDVYAAVTRNPMVAAADRFTNVSVPHEDAQIYLASNEFDVLLTHGNLLFKEPANGRAAVRAAGSADARIVSEAFALKYKKEPGDEVTLRTRAGDRRFRVVAVYYDYASDRGQVTMDRSTFTRHFGDVSPTGLTVYLRPGADPERVRADLLESLSPDARIHIYTNRALRTEVLRIFDSTFAITYALEVIAILVAILGVAATLLTLVLERRRELAMLRLVGAGRRQVRRMVVLEAVMMGGVSQAIGLIVGVLLSLVLIYVVNVQTFGWTIQFHLPWSFLTQMSLAMILAAGLAGVYPARLAARMSVASEVAEE